MHDKSKIRFLRYACNLHNTIFTKKHSTLKLLNYADMPCFDNVNRERAIGMLDAGLSQVEVSRRFGVHQSTINRLVGRLRRTQSTDNRPRFGRPRVMSHVRDRYIRLRFLQNRYTNAVSIAADLPFQDSFTSTCCRWHTSTEDIPWSSSGTASLASTLRMGS